MAYLKCFGVGVLLAFAGGAAWLLYLFFSVARSVPPELRRGSGAINILGLFDNRVLLVLLIFFVVGFFIEFLIVKRSLLHAR